MDARIDPAAAFGIDLGDAHVIRNAGASARDAIRSIVISEQLLGTQEVLLVKHTGTHALSIPASLNKSSHLMGSELSHMLGAARIDEQAVVC
jgi:carbonic anhydrase